MTCTVSWMRLEQYVLGDLAEPEQREVHAHVGGCPKCQRFLGVIEGDERPMPDLVVPSRRPPWGWLSVGGLALAALALGVLRAGPDVQHLPGPERRVKGGELAVGLVRERDGAVQENPWGYRSGDQLRVRVTCPPGPREVRLEVREGELAPQVLAEGWLDCRNQVPVGDPFVLTGHRDVAVCVTLDPHGAPETVCRWVRNIDE